MSAPGKVLLLVCLGALMLLLASPAASAAEELRGLWVDTFHPALRNEAEARQLVAAARLGGFNALFVEVRKRGDAYYDSRFEPRATDVGPGFDPLQRLLGLAHDITDGPRLQVHAWIVAFNIWNQRTTLPPQPDHPYRRHPDWLTRDNTGNLWDGANYAFDPGHPDVQRHTFNVAMDLITRYEIDGLHWDYVRYAGRQWGYNDVAIQRFNTLFNRTGVPPIGDPDWQQFRRDQVTGLVRKVYLSAFALKPHLTLSAATITFAPGIPTTAQWPASAAFSDVLQDWRAWMEEGILDFNVPMAYFRQPEFSQALANWNIFIKDHQYRRRAAIGLAFYLNSVSNSFTQIQLARQPSPRGERAVGVVAYSYANPAVDASLADVLTSLTQPSRFATNPPFATPAPAASTPWKSHPGTGHLKGFVLQSTDATPVDGATLTLCGASEVSLLTDATGFFGAVDLPVGNYQVRVRAPGFEGSSADVTVRGALVSHIGFSLVRANPANPADLHASAGTRSAAISWTTPSPSTGSVNLRIVSDCDLPQHLPSSQTGTNHTVFVDSLTPDTDYEFTVTTVPLDSEPVPIFTSEPRNFRTAGTTVVDNPQARFTGGWTLSTSGTAKLGADYRVANTIRASSIPSIATYETRLGTPGRYAVETWFPATETRSRNAPFEILDADGSRIVPVNQSLTREGWTILAPSAPFRPDSPGMVRIRNNTDETGRTVAADAVRWTYLPENDLARPDRLPAWWAVHYFGTPTPRPAPDQDPDSDGLTSAEEYLLGTDPTDPSSHLAVGLTPITPGRWRIDFHPWIPSRTYRLQFRIEAAASTWQTLPAAPESDGRGGGSFVADADPGSRGLFQVQVLWP